MKITLPLIAQQFFAQVGGGRRDWEAGLAQNIAAVMREFKYTREQMLEMPLPTFFYLTELLAKEKEEHELSVFREFINSLDTDEESPAEGRRRPD